MVLYYYTITITDKSTIQAVRYKAQMEVVTVEKNSISQNIDASILSLDKRLARAVELITELETLVSEDAILIEIFRKFFYQQQIPTSLETN